jgi:hypothetical protein
MLHHPTALLIALAVLVFLAAIVRLVAGNPASARHRVRILRWRIRLYLRLGPGYANILELAVRWSRLRAVRTGRRARPSLPWWLRMLLPVTAYAVRLGRAHLGRRVIASMEDQTLVLAAPRTGKSGWLADRIIDHPGAVVTTTTRTDLFDNTAPLRGRRGEVHVFNPEGIGGLPSTFRWNPLRGCEQPAVALQRAASFTSATESTGMQDLAFWVGKATSALACLLHAAALADRTMTDVYRWAHGIGDDEPERILSTHSWAAEGWLGPIQEIRRPGRTADSIRMTVTRALSWLADPAVAAATSPGTGEGFDVADFVAGPHTLYMIGTGREEAPIAPLFRAFAEHVHAGCPGCVAKSRCERTPGPAPRMDGGPAPPCTSRCGCCRPNCCAPCPNGGRSSCAATYPPSSSGYGWPGGAETTVVPAGSMWRRGDRCLFARRTGFAHRCRGQAWRMTWPHCLVAMDLAGTKFGQLEWKNWPRSVSSRVRPRTGETRDTPRQPPPGEGSVPRPRRPWDPPADSGDHK